MGKILLIDDDDLIRYLADELTARHEVECLKRAESGPDLLAQGDHDLVLLDNRMPPVFSTAMVGACRPPELVGAV